MPHFLAFLSSAKGFARGGSFSPVSLQPDREGEEATV